MRSRVPLRKPTVALLLALTLAQPAHANPFADFFKNLLGWNKAPAPVEGVAKTDVDPTKRPEQKTQDSWSIKSVFEGFTVEKDLINASFNKTDKGVAQLQGVLNRASEIFVDKANLVDTATHTEIIPAYDEKGLFFKFRYDETAAKDLRLLLKDFMVLDVFLNATMSKKEDTTILTHALEVRLPESLRKELSSPHSIAEMMMNARAGSPAAKARWNDIELQILKNTAVKSNFVNSLNLDPQILKDIIADLEAKKASLDAAASVHLRAQQKAIDTWREKTQTLDAYENAELKLNDLILNNDRPGVRKMIEAYLPWAVMEPVEVRAWKNWLDAIENPNWEKTTIGFRGLDYKTDRVQRKDLGNGKLSIGFMSTVLTQNQGSYTRRLRSLSTNRLKNGDRGFGAHGSTLPAVKIVDQMIAHAVDPKASSFLSFTYSPSIAHRFMAPKMGTNAAGETVPQGAFLAVRMDSRRLFSNIGSMYGHEIELLAPLLVFPDEVVGFKEGTMDAREVAEYVEQLRVEKNLHFPKVGTADAAKIYAQQGHDYLKEMMDIQSTAKSCNAIFQ